MSSPRPRTSRDAKSAPLSFPGPMNSLRREKAQEQRFFEGGQDELNELCETYPVSRKEAYEMYSQFNSLRLMEADEAGRSPRKGGVSLGFFIENCMFLKGVLESTAKRLLTCVGLDADQSTTVVDWDSFVRLYCVVKKGELSLELMVEFWVKFFDPARSGKVSEEDYTRVLEELVRGRSFSVPNKFTMLFARNFQKSLQRSGCLGDAK